MTNWLSFSRSPMDLLRSSQSAADHRSHFAPYEATTTHPYFLDNIYDNGWNNPKEEKATAMGEEGTLLTALIGAPPMHHPAPKLEDFLGDSSCHTDGTQDDSTLTQIYDSHQHGGCSSYFKRDANDFKAIHGFPTFPSNSGSEVDSSLARAQQQLTVPLSLGVIGDFPIMNSSCNNNRGNRINKETTVIRSGVPDAKKILDNFGQRTSIYRGVTRHRWTGRYEAHLWDNSCRREGQARKGRQVYLGGYDKEEKAARAYDLAALKYWGPTATTNFPVSSYSKELEAMKYISKQEFIASLRRKSSGFSRGASIYRGVTRHHQQGRWQARIGRVAGNKDLYLGTFATEEEAAEAYDIAAIKFRGLNAVTNFEMSRYDVEAIMKSALPIGGAAKRLKVTTEPDPKPMASVEQFPNGGDVNFGSMQQLAACPFDASLYHHHNQVFHHFPPHNSVLAVDVMNASPSMVPPSEFFIWPHQPY